MFASAYLLGYKIREVTWLNIGIYPFYVHCFSYILAGRLLRKPNTELYDKEPVIRSALQLERSRILILGWYCLSLTVKMRALYMLSPDFLIIPCRTIGEKPIQKRTKAWKLVLLYSIMSDETGHPVWDSKRLGQLLILNRLLGFRLKGAYF